MPAEALPWHTPQWARVERMLAGGRLPHALLLAGPEGVGKAWFAQRLAARLLCLEPPQGTVPCGACDACHWFEARSHPDYLQLAPEDGKAPIRVDAVRAMIAFTELTRAAGRYKVVVMLEAERMNPAAANSLLKTLEEPPQGTVLILVSAAASRLPATVRSRCQTLRFPPVQPATARRWLAERLEGAVPEDLSRAELAAPLHVIERERGGERIARIRCARLLAAAVKGEIPLAELVQALEETAPQHLLEWMIDWTAGAVHARVTGAVRPGDEGVRPALEALCGAVPLQALWVLYDELVAQRRTGMAGLNERLLRERLVLDWMHAGRRTGGTAKRSG